MTAQTSIGDRTGVRALLAPTSVLVVGASGNTTLLSGVVLRALRRYGFPGRVVGVNPKHQEIMGFTCYPDIDQVPADEHFDLAYIAVRRELVPDIVWRCGARGIRAAVVISSGFAEVADGAAVQRDLVAAAREYDMAICGPNCAGIANFHANFVGVGTNNFIELDEIVTGGAAVITASGGLGNTIFSYLQAHRIGCSHLVSLGNEAVTTAAAYLEELVDDPAVTMIVAYLEQIREPERFFAAVARAHDAGKPVVLLKPGKTEVGRDAMRTHTAALSGSREAYEAWCRRYGVILVDDIDELAETAVALQRVGPATGDGIGLFSLPGGGLALVADHAADNGFHLPPLSPAVAESLREVVPPLAAVKNPLDPTAGFRDSPLMNEAMHRMAQEPAIDVLVYFPLVSQVDIADNIADHLIALRARLDKPLVCIWTVGATPELEAGPWRRLRDAGVALYTRTAQCFTALARQRDHARFRHDWPRRRELLAASIGTDAPAVAGTAEIVDRLADRGLRVPRTVLAPDAETAVAAARDIGGPVAVKVSSPDIAHKSDVGGVRVGVVGDDAVRAAYREVVDSARTARPEATIRGAEIQEMVPGGVEVLLGVTTEPDLGPMLAIGAGGVLTEILRDVVLTPVPVTADEAMELLRRLRIWPILAGFRGQPPADVAALSEVVVALSEVAHTTRTRAPEIDLNPVVVGPAGSGVWLVDVLARLRGSGGPDGPS